MLSAALLFKDALYGALVLSVVCSALGVYVVLRRIVFVGAAIAELSSMGIAMAMWLSGMGWLTGAVAHPIAFSVVFALAGALFFGAGGGQRSGVPPDATIGVTYAVAAAVGILLIAKAQHGEAHDIFLQGNILGITRGDVYLLIAVSIPVLLIHLLFYKEFLFISFDRETARTLGYRVTFWNLLLYFTIGLVIAFAMQFAGVMLVFNYLVLPAVTGMLIAHTMRGIFTVAVVSALISSLIGFSLSVPFDLPTGPAIIATSGVVATIAWIVRAIQRR
jgi:ABC-type Mn2+/Zn2+ transport system permease subunit